MRKLKIFGFRIDGIPEQLNLLFDENKTTMTNCLNSVLSMIDWTMQIQGADYLTCMIHVANCLG